MTPEVLVYRVVSLGLNLRSRPEVLPSTRVAVLPQAQIVFKIGVAQDDSWWQIATTLHDTPLVGFANRNYLAPAENRPSLQTGDIPEVHLSENVANARRGGESGRAYPIGEASRPTRTGPSAHDNANQLTAIVNWLEVETSRRYLPGDAHTYCNIYACDYCYLASAYLPRVWWTPGSLARWLNHQPVQALYNQTIRELSANSLFDWLVEFSGLYGWTRAVDFTAIQKSVNDGMVAVACGQNKDLNESGHIAVIVPETAAHQAVWEGGIVKKMLLSQAGAHNRSYDTVPWWEMDQFRDHGFWRHS